MATMQPASYDPAWTVNGIAPRTTVINGQPVTGHTVTFTTKAGNMSEVFVPDSVASLDAAKTIIAARAAYVDGIASLRG